jgi:hypothetical protein
MTSDGIDDNCRFVIGFCADEEESFADEEEWF